MIDFPSILTEDRVELVSDCKSRKSALSKAAHHLATADSPADASQILQALVQREQLGSTALDDSGVALPHCRVEGCCAPRAALLLLDDFVKFGPEWDVRLIVALVVPTEQANEHLEILQTIAKVFSNAEHAARLLACESANRLHQHFLTFARESSAP